ncbi:hypothetical protein ACFFQF_27090 [Haladaptatus pallidirubidus]|uniref:DUF4064 domain-containing protein n=1 Tax=Haladaptatus pallidirubidus TaxID=1008152 RepID=A0AAV3UGZ6_9EURY|nr:hypothetical protein [Haladaptatus pallidirubidus]
MNNRPSRLEQGGQISGLSAMIAGILGVLYMLFTFVIPYLSISVTGIRFSHEDASLGAANAPVFAFWSGVLLVISLLAGYAVLRGILWAIWLLAIGLGVLTLLGLFSIGLIIAPAAVLLLLAALLLTGDRRRKIDPRHNPPLRSS